MSTPQSPGVGKNILMRVNVAGFQGAASTVFAAFNPSTDVLRISRKAPKYEDARREGFLLVTTQERDKAQDQLFNEEDTRDAIKAFYEMRDMGLLTFNDGLGGIDPGNKIERDGVDENGVKYRLHPDVGNDMVAVLIAAHVANKQRHYKNVASMAEALMTIGGVAGEMGAATVEEIAQLNWG